MIETIFTNIHIFFIVIIVIQAVTFTVICFKISALTKTVDMNSFKIKKYSIPTEDLKKGEYKIILKNLTDYEEDSNLTDEANNSYALKEEKLLLKSDSKKENRLVHSINYFLLRKKESLANLHIIRDIVERYSKKKIQYINQITFIPLYIGLVGTMLVTWCKIHYLLNNYQQKVFQWNICILILIILPIFLSLVSKMCYYFFKLKKIKGLQNKNERDFYAFIEKKVPVASDQNEGVKLLTDFKEKLKQFNFKSKKTIKMLLELLSKNQNTEDEQEKILYSLKKLGIAVFIEENIIILEHFKKPLSNLNEYLSVLNSTISEADELSETLQLLLKNENHFQNLEGFFENIYDYVNENNYLRTFLNNHNKNVLKKIDESDKTNHNYDFAEIEKESYNSTWLDNFF